MTPVLTVSEVTQIIKNLFDSSEVLRHVYVKGEISNFKHHISGHMYFTLKDERAQIRCIMFKSKNVLLPFYPENGMKVIALGQISVFEKTGEYQLYVEDLEPDGIGALHMAFEKLKAKLEKEGLFDAARKREIPFLPRKIGLITSLTGAAIRDLLTVIKRRFPNVDIVIAPVLVQGREAADEICAALRDMNCFKDIDVIIVGRGGGSIEELWAFNEEKVARAIFHSKIPVISAVGHETDFTIADFVADKRAPTPSAAGEMVVPEKSRLQNDIVRLRARLINAAVGFVNIKRQQLEYARRSAVFTSPGNLIVNFRLTLDMLSKRLLKETKILIDSRRLLFKNHIGKLQALNPLSILERGYSICQIAGTDKIVTKIQDVADRDMVRVLLSDGNLICEVKGSEKRGAKRGIQI